MVTINVEETVLRLCACWRLRRIPYNKKECVFRNVRMQSIVDNRFIKRSTVKEYAAMQVDS